MKTELARLKRYMQEALSAVISPNPWSESAHLPFFLRDRYTFFETQLLEVPCLLMLDRGKQEHSPATVHKHMDQVKARWDGEIVYVKERVTAYNRKRLIEHKVPFVVPGNQMYLPLLGIDLREHFKKLRAETVIFSPSTQALILHILLRGNAKETVTPAEMAQRLGYSAMTMTRAFDELESAGLGEVMPEGRERRLRFIESANDIWAKAKPFLRSPVKRRLIINQPNLDPPGPRAGLTALANYSMLAEPANPVFALSREDWKSLKQSRQVEELPAKEMGALEIEVWSYAPTLFAENKLVDRLSLYLSLKESKDERIEAALAEMMKGQQW
jgi:DNA-binding MarR family transcriptional regulator